jgi:integrase/recombinase XerD
MAEMKLEEMLEAMNPTPKAPTIVDQWATDARIRGMAPGTIQTYRKCLRLIEKSNGAPILEMDKLQIREYVDSCRSRKLTTQTIGGHLNALNSFFEFAQFENLRKDNPVLEARRRYLHQYKKNSSGETHTHKIISVQDAAHLVETAVDIRDKAILLVLLKTGIRRGELVSLEVEDINWQDQSITLKPVAKRTNRIVFFDDETAHYLRRWLATREHRNKNGIAGLWISSYGRKLAHQGVSDMIQLTATRAGLHDTKSDQMEDHFSAHCCRHWLVTHLLRAGMIRDHVKWIRGDAMKEAIDIYYHISPEDVRKSYLAHVPQLGV